MVGGAEGEEEEAVEGEEGEGWEEREEDGEGWDETGPSTWADKAMACSGSNTGLLLPLLLTVLLLLLVLLVVVEETGGLNASVEEDMKDLLSPLLDVEAPALETMGDEGEVEVLAEKGWEGGGTGEEVGRIGGVNAADEKLLLVLSPARVLVHRKIRKQQRGQRADSEERGRKGT